MKRTWELFLKEAVIVIFCAIAGVIALAATYFIPQGKMWDKVYESSIVLHNEGLGAHIWQNIEETMLDVYTDGLLLNVSYTETKDGIRDILLDTYVEVDGRNPMESFYEVSALSNDEYIVRNYGRYWHGYQIILRPLLCFFTYSDIRQINMILQLVLVFLLICILAGSKDRIFIIPFGGMYLFMCPISLFSSLQFSPCFYIMMLTLIVLFACKDVLNDKRTNYLFLVAGILTAYFDLLTYPLITLGIPLLAYLGLDYKWISDDRRKGWKQVFLLTASWCLGYGGMWSAKWVVTTILTGENIIYDAFEKIKFRSGYFSVKHSYYDTLKLNLNVCNRKVLMLAAVCIGIYILTVRVKDHIGVDRGLLPLVGMLLMVSLYPFGWYFFTKNHSSSHSYFTWRELAISVFGILMIGVVRIRQFRDSFSA
ncbi:MAG: hypothetical protein HDR07_08940 [Lachnospiraceae bacterium]|nr:hypothetical protein [Lachnospiraceae bacterium]